MTSEDAYARGYIVRSDDLITERAKTHGDFKLVAFVFQRLKAVCDNHQVVPLSDIEQFARDNALAKYARIVAGDPKFIDHWRDAAGYPTLVVNQLEAEACRNKTTSQDVRDILNGYNDKVENNA